MRELAKGRNCIPKITHIIVKKSMEKIRTPKMSKNFSEKKHQDSEDFF